MKKIVKALLLLAIVFTSVFTVAACKSVDEISVKTAPQTTYIVGQSLDLSKGELLAVSGGEEEVISMTDADVSVSGYDSSTKGTQTVTVTYKKKSTTFDVKVVDRIEAENYKKDYFVGEKFDGTTGRIRVTRDDGTSYAIAMNDSKVSFGNITATQAGETTVDVRYINGSIDYSGKVAVTLHNIDNVEFSKPTKISYYTHDSGIDLSGGYLTLIGNGGKLEKDIPLTDATVTGFDLSAATKENKTTALIQKIYVSYAGKSHSYDIKITYTDVAEIKTNAAGFADLDWESATMPSFTEEQGELAVATAQMYFDMLSAHKALITETERLAIIRLAMAHSLNKWTADLAQYKNAFTFDANGLLLTCESKNLLKADIAKLNNFNRDFYKYGEIITDIVDEFEDSVLGMALGMNAFEKLYGEEVPEDMDEIFEQLTFSFCEVISPDEFKADILPVLQYMVDLSDKLPAACTAENVADYATQVKATYDFIAGSKYLTADYVQIYGIVSSWRANDDFADIIYTYLYNNDKDAMADMASIMLPGDLTEMYNVVFMIYDEIQLMSYDPYTALSQTGVLVYDSSNFFYMYYTLDDADKAFRNGEYGDMEKYFYEEVSIAGLLGANGEYYFTNLLEEIKYAEGGYCDVLEALNGVAAGEAVIKQYIDILMNISEDEKYESSAQYGVDMEALFNAYVALSPSSLTGVNSALNVYYEYGLPLLSCDTMSDRLLMESMFGDTLENILASMGVTDQEEIDKYIQDNGLDNQYFATEFANIMVTYYKEKLTTKELDKAFHNLLRAVESFSLRYSKATAHDDFVEYLGAVTTAYNTEFSDTEKVEFNAHFGDLYNKYLAVAAVYEEGYEATALGEWADDFALLQEACQNAVDSYTAIQSGSVAISAFYIACEKANYVANYIKENAPEDILFAFYYEPNLKYSYVDYDEEGNSENVSFDYTGDYYSSLVRYVCSDINSTLALHGSLSAELKDFMAKAYNATYVYGDEKSAVEFDDQFIVDAMKAFAALDVEDQGMFYTLDIYSGSEYPFYAVMILTYFEAEMTAGAAEVATALVYELEASYIYYQIEQTEEYLGYMEESLVKCKEAYEALSDADKQSFSLIYEVYEDYVAKCEALIAEAKADQE